jgi:predicted DCC family thiol-disulfide oxidoreductase YuxK
MKRDHAIVLFDGVCHLCTSTVQFIIKRDPHGYFTFAALQSGVPGAIAGFFTVSRLSEQEPRTFVTVLINKNRVLRDSYRTRVVG